MASGRSSRVKMRSRPIDTNKALFIADTSQREPDDMEIEAAIASAPGGGGHGGGGNHGGGGHGHSGHTGQGDGMIVGVGIPTPPIYIDLDYHKRLDYGRFIQPSYYIKAHQTAGTNLVNHVDRYDLLQEDIEWLAAYNAAVEQKRPPGPTMTEDDMERLVDLFEHQAGKITLNGMRAEMMSIEDKIDPRKDFPLVRAIVVAATALHVRTKIVEPVYEYWIDKRRRLGKALLRQFVEPPPRGNTDPHVAFRVRTEGRRISKRNPRKDDHSGYHKMVHLRKDFQKIVDILDHVQTREQLKREQALLAMHIFDARLQATPWAQAMMAAHPVAATAIAQLQAIPPPPSSLAGAPSPALPPALLSASPDDIRAFRLLHSAQPPCSYSRAELEAEGRRRRAQNQQRAQQQTAAHSAQQSAHAHSSSSHHHHGQKRPGHGHGQSSSSANQRRGASSQGGGGHGGGGTISGHHHGHRDDARHREKEHRKAARRELGYALVPLDDEPEDQLDVTDEEDLLSENEEEARFYREVEQHVKRMKIERAQHPTASDTSRLSANAATTSTTTAGTPGVKVEPHGAIGASRSYPPTLPPHQPYPPPSSVRPLIPPGGKVGYLTGGAAGRGGRIWIDCEYRQIAAAHQQNQHQQQGHPHQYQHPHHRGQTTHHQQQQAHQQQQRDAAHPHPPHAQAQAQPSMRIHVHPPSASASSHVGQSTGAPMEIDQRTHPTHTTHQPPPMAMPMQTAIQV